MMHVIAFTAYQQNIQSFQSSELACSMNQIQCLSLEASSEQERFIQTQHFQHREALRSKTTIAQWIYAFGGLHEKGLQPKLIIDKWNADCKARGNMPAAIQGGKRKAIDLWIYHSTQMKLVSQPQRERHIYQTLNDPIFVDRTFPLWCHFEI